MFINKVLQVSSSIRVPRHVKINVENSDHAQNSTRYQTCEVSKKEEEKTLIPVRVWYVEKLILTQYCFKPAAAAIGNVP